MKKDDKCKSNREISHFQAQRATFGGSFQKYYSLQLHTCVILVTNGQQFIILRFKPSVFILR